MPLMKRPYVVSADQVRITREGDDAVIEYADDTVATTHLKMGADKLTAMTDEELLDFWNHHIAAREDDRQSSSYTATEIPVGKPPDLPWSDRRGDSRRGGGADAWFVARQQRPCLNAAAVA